MATATKLKSGMWRCRGFVGTDIHGNKIVKSFTAETKAEAEYLAADYVRRHKGEGTQMTFGGALDNYIKSREGKRSPTTIREYKRAREKDFTDIETMQLSKINQKVIQKHIDLYAENHSAKTVKNHHGLISAVMRLYRPEMALKTALPTRCKEDKVIPTNSQIKAIMDAAKGTDLELPILLAAFGPMRRGEICALRSENIYPDRVYVRENMVKNSDNEWVIKEPKTKAGNRVIVFPDFVNEKLQKVEGRVTELNPDNITNYFNRLLKRNKLPHISFHSLRHYSASILHAWGMPTQYIQERGGWENARVLEEIYRHSLDDISLTENKKVNDKFNEIFGEVDTKS